MFAANLAVVVESGREMQEVLGEWMEAFGKHGRKMSMEKTEVMWVRQRRKYMNIRLEGKEIRQGNRVEYLGVTGVGKSKAEVQSRNQVGMNVWRRVEGVMTDKDIKKIEREGSDVYNAGLPLRPGDGGNDRENNRSCRFVRTTESGGLRVRRGEDWCADEFDGEIGEMLAELGLDTWCGWGKRENGKESG